jgi:hypothetical protein
MRCLCGVKKSDRSFRNQIGEVLARADGFNCVEETGPFFSENRAIAFWMDDLPCRPSATVSFQSRTIGARGSSDVSWERRMADDRPLAGRPVDETADVRL